MIVGRCLLGADGILNSYRIECCDGSRAETTMWERVTGILPLNIFGELGSIGDIEAISLMVGHIIHMGANYNFSCAKNAQICSFMQVEHEPRYHCHRYAEGGKRSERAGSFHLNAACRTCWRTMTNRLGGRAKSVI